MKKDPFKTLGIEKQAFCDEFQLKLKGTDWERGFKAGQNKQPNQPPNGVDGLAWSSGYIEGKANQRTYCTQNAGDCSTCSLVNYGKDCMNNPV
jgi:hypothetical protein